MMTKSEKPKVWNKPELIKLGALKDVANGGLPGTDAKSNGSSTKLS